MVERIHNHLKKIDQNQRVLTLFLLGVDGSLGHHLFGLQSFEFLLSFPNSHTHSEKGRWKRKIQFTFPTYCNQQSPRQNMRLEIDWVRDLNDKFSTGTESGSRWKDSSTTPSKIGCETVKAMLKLAHGAMDACVCWTVLVVHVGQTMKFSMQENRKSKPKK